MSKVLPAEVLAGIVRASRDGVLVAETTDGAPRAIHANPAFLLMTGYDQDEILGTDCAFLLGEQRGQRGLKRLRDALAAGREAEVLLRNFRKSGEEFWNLVRIVPVADGDEPRWWLAVCRDVGETRDLRDRLRHQEKALRAARSEVPVDRTTGLKSRAFFDEVLRREWAAAAREERSLTLYLFDPDHFSLYNETFGRSAGDSTLRLVGRAVSGAFRRASDLCVRFDGHRFACLAGAAGKDNALAHGELICGRVRDLSVHHPRSPGGRYLTVSGGVLCVGPTAEQVPEAAIAALEAAVRAAKAAGGNQIAAAGMAAAADDQEPADEPG